VSGVTIRGDAHTWWDKASGAYETSRHPSRGAVIVMRGYNSDTRGHVGVVRKILDDRQISIDHANWGNREEVQLDTPVMDVSNANDWSKVRVWNLKDGHFGGRVYDVEGFILPERRSAGGLFW
jgi:surface antigen